MLTDKLLNITGKSKLITNIILEISNFFLSKHTQTVLSWKLCSGDNTLRLNYPLTDKSVVFDVGGYEGDWSADIYNKYQCNIFIFEPVNEYAKRIEKRFQNIKKIHVFPYGLSHETKYINLHLADNGTSEFGISNKVIKVKLTNIKNVLDKYNIKNIDLIKLNIEGGEYDLLEYIVKANIVKKLKNIQVQFHSFVKNAKSRSSRIQNSLQKTHKLTYQFPFVWENWILKK